MCIQLLRGRHATLGASTAGSGRPGPKEGKANEPFCPVHRACRRGNSASISLLSALLCALCAGDARSGCKTRSSAYTGPTETLGFCHSVVLRANPPGLPAPGLVACSKSDLGARGRGEGNEASSPKKPKPANKQRGAVVSTKSGQEARVGGGGR